jgi:predicted GTPase
MTGGDGGDPWVVVLLGATGVGKSATGNSILEDKRAFVIGSTANSCTNKTTIKDGVAGSIGVPIRIIDTPGYGDSNGNDKHNIKEMATFLQRDVGFVHAFLLVLNGESMRCDANIISMLKVCVLKHARYANSYRYRHMLIYLE